MAVHITAHRSGFPFGRTPVTHLVEEDSTGIALSVLKLRAGERVRDLLERETAYLLMGGQVRFRAGDEARSFSRASLFDDLPSAVHAGRGASVEVEALTEVELTLYETANGRPLPTVFHPPEGVRDEWRGLGQVRNAALRAVRTVFDRATTHPDAELVLGEVVNLPGRWSSYPPHHHPQPEIYHYRFSRPEGWGHAELGETVLKVRSGDTVKIFDGRDHPQCAAPGYGMYYAWVIRHLEGAPYQAPVFTEEHRWVLDGDPGFWPRRVPE